MSNRSRAGKKEQGAAAVRLAARRTPKQATPEQYQAQRLAQINALRASRGMAPMTDAAEAIIWERNLRLGVRA